MAREKGILTWVNALLILAILIVVNFIGSYFHTQLDLTQDRRFSLTKPTKKLISELDETIYVKVLLDGNFPAGFTRLKNETRNLLSKFNSINSNVIFEFENPSDGSITEINAARKELAKDKIVPVNLRFMEGDEMTNKAIYPYAIVRKGAKKIVVNILEPQVPGMPEETTLNNSVSLLEYKIVDAIQKLNLVDKPNIAITRGHGELTSKQTAALERKLRQFYDTGRVNTDSIFQLSPEIDLLIVPSPKTAFKPKEQFVIDQYIMNGGKVIWLIDYLDVTLDSINRNGFYVPPVRELGLEDMFFKYGFRVQPDLVLDLECTRIPQVVGMAGEKAQIELVKWPYHPLVATNAFHPISKNLDRVNVFFPSTIDTLKTKLPTKKTPLLRSSPYTRYQLTPVRLNFEVLKYEMDEAKFSKDPRDLAVLIEGEFESHFKNRMTEGTLAMLDKIEAEFKESSVPTKQLIVSDADFIKNQYDANSDRISELGFNKWEKTKFQGNEDFIFNAIEYMLDENGVLESRSKEVKLRLLDRIKAQNEKTKWRVINIVLPLLLLGLFAFIFNYTRKKRFLVP